MWLNAAEWGIEVKLTSMSESNFNTSFTFQVRNAFRRQREKNALSKEYDSQYPVSFSLSVSVHMNSQGWDVD